MRRCHATYIGVALTGMLVGTACTQADLIPVVRETSLERQKIVGEVCAPAPTEEFAPYKVLFVIDTSLSNAWNDPEGRREAAVRNAITSMLDEETVSFGIITFSDEPRRQTFGFTRDQEILNGATENVSNAQGGTNYSDTLWAVIDFILDDITTLSPVEAARTHYMVFWLSDGFPTVGVTDPSALVPSVDYLVNQVQDRVAEIQFNAAFLGAADSAPEGDSSEAEALLRELASRGNGAYTSIQAGESFSFEIERQPIQTHYEFAFAYASNQNALFAPDGPAADSDGDGLLDTEEAALGLDPTRPDTDEDGYRDGVEYFTPGILNPTEFDPGCTEGDVDTDGDGLRDCEEKSVGTLVYKPDSDDDLILDLTEVLVGTAAALDDTDADDDLDNIPNPDEVRFHLDPQFPNTPDQAGRWSYRYKIEESLRGGLEASPCYTFHVDNLTMAQTLAVDDHPEGGNVIEVVVAFRGGSRTHFVRAELRGRMLRDKDYYDPPNGVFELTDQDFWPIKPD